MQEIVAADYPLTGEQVTRDDGDRSAFGTTRSSSSSREQIPEGEPITLYTIGAFIDLCRGRPRPLDRRDHST